MLNNVYQMVQQQNSQALADRLTLIGENIHNVNPRNNILQQATSHKTIIPELMRDPKEVHKSPSLCHRHHTHSPGPEGRKGSHNPHEAHPPRMWEMREEDAPTQMRKKNLMFAHILDIKVLSSLKTTSKL